MISPRVPPLPHPAGVIAEPTHALRTQTPLWRLVLQQSLSGHPVLLGDFIGQFEHARELLLGQDFVHLHALERAGMGEGSNSSSEGSSA
jgi:hypothetical protein